VAVALICGWHYGVACRSIRVHHDMVCVAQGLHAVCSGAFQVTMLLWPMWVLPTVFGTDAIDPVCLAPHPVQAPACHDVTVHPHSAGASASVEVHALSSPLHRFSKLGHAATWCTPIFVWIGLVEPVGHSTTVHPWLRHQRGHAETTHKRCTLW
jgi:hypothetical protein